MRLSYDPLYDSGMIGVVVTLLVIALLFLITPRGVSRTRRAILLGLRGIAAIALLLVLLRPSLVRTDNRPAAATLAIAIDTSRSMTLASGDQSAGDSSQTVSSEVGIAGAENRWQQQQRVLAALADRIASLDDHLNVTLYRYDAQSERLISGPAGDFPASLIALKSIGPDGMLTDLSAPLEAAVAASRGTPLAGITLLSDGTQTLQSQPGAADPLSTARLVAAIGVPLWTVSLGPPATMSRLQDVAVQTLPETYRMFTGNETEINFEVQTLGYENTPIELSVVWVSADQTQKVAATRTVTPSQNTQTQAMSIPVLAPEPGQYRLIVSARSPAGETDTANDQQLAFVDVRAGGGRVLYLEGTPRMEQMYLRKALGRFPDLEITYRWIPRDTSSRWPASLDDDLQTGRYDVIVLGDLHSAALGKTQLDRIADLVGAGTALLTLGGERAYDPGGYADSALANVLPVKMNAALAQPPGIEVNLATAPQLPGDAPPILPGQMAGPIVLQTTRSHPITKTNRREANRPEADPWKSLLPMPGANRFIGVKAAPGVQVLLEDEQAQPMMVVGEYGEGRVATLAFDSTWIWWRGGESEFHRRFWRQLMLWLLSREETETGELELTMTRRRFTTSESSTFSAIRTVGESGTQPTGEWSAIVKLESGERRVLNLSTATQTSGGQRITEATGEISQSWQPGIAASTANADAETSSNNTESNRWPAGLHRLQVQLDVDGRAKVSAELPFQIIDDTRELSASSADHAMLERLALMTEAAGGESFRADQIDELVERISTQRRRAEQAVIEKWRVGDGPTSGWLVFALFAGCLSCEWTLRRRWGLA